MEENFFDKLEIEEELKNETVQNMSQKNLKKFTIRIGRQRILARGNWRLQSRSIVLKPGGTKLYSIYEMMEDLPMHKETP